MLLPRPARRAGPVTLVAALVLSFAPPAAASPTELVENRSPAASEPAETTITLEVAPGDHRVTLISGDQVTLVDLGGGSYRIDVTRAPRPDGTLPTTMDVQVTEDGAYVMPGDALPAIAAGILDRELFNVALLAESGYTDAAMDELPVIVQQPEAGLARSAAAALPGAEVERELPVIDAAAVSVPKADAAETWEALRVEPATAAHRSASRPAPKVWLDRMNQVVLQDSVPQVGAPQAWDAGFDGTGATVAVLDTGVDAGHPDLAGQIVDAESFVPGTDVTDRHGHGTHVASTVAGTGAASGGDQRGVAPGAELLVGKVCDDNGQCPDSWVIAGMEWAAAQGADVVSMSLGSLVPSDGTDPLSQAVNQLTEQTDTLFVIAAGNNGSDYFISSPGAADAALTVGAVTKTDQLASFTNRGPRGPRWFGDYAIKPEVVAPGVHITAARAAGTSLCQNACIQPGDGPVDEHYTAASGTSMATPHVAGAAAILAAQHPDLGPEALKAALVSTAEDAGYTVYEQGGGRLDVARAVRQQVRVTPAVADFRTVEVGTSPQPRTLTYTNPTEADVILDLTAELSDIEGGATGELILSSARLTVPAGGAASVTVTVGEAASGTYSGRVTAVGPDGTQLTTPVGLAVLPPVHRLTVTYVPRADESGCGFFCPFAYSFSVVGIDGPARGFTDFVFDYDFLGTGDYLVPGHVFAVPEGTYRVLAQDMWETGDIAVSDQLSWLTVPEVEVFGDTEVVIDANDARRVTVGETPRPSERYSSEVDECYTQSNGFTYGCSMIWHDNTWVLPSEPVTNGSYEFAAHWLLGPPPVTMVTTGRDRLDLRPSAQPYGRDFSTLSRFPAGTHRLPVVDVGSGTEADFARVDAEGALAFMSGSCISWDPHWERAESEGAVGLLVPVHQGCHMPHLGPIYDPRTTIPVAQIPPAETVALIDRLAAGPVTVTMTGTPEPDYLYRLSAHEADGVPADPSYSFTAAEMATVDHHLHSAEPAQVVLQQQTYLAGPSFVGPIAAADLGEFQAPATVRVYTAPAAPEAPLTWGLAAVRGDQPRPLCGLNNLPSPACEQSVDVLPEPGGYAEVHWNADPTAVGAPAMPDGSGVFGELPLCAGCRQGDTFVALTNLTTAQPGHWRGYVDAADSETQLFRDGEEVPATPLTITRAPYQGEVDSYQLPPEPADYRLTQRFGSVETSWWFTSGQVTADRTPPETVCAGTFQNGVDTPCRAEPLIFLRYDAGVDLSNSVAAPGAHFVRVGAYHQDPGGPEIAGIRAWYSTDGGDEWRQARTLGRIRDGEVRVLVVAPPLPRTDGTVSLRVEAWDREGNRVEQTIVDAYGLQRRLPPNLLP